MRNNNHEQDRVIEKTMHFLESLHPVMSSEQRYLHACRFLQAMEDLKATQAAIRKLARLSVAEYEARLTPFYFDLSESTDSLLVIRNRINGEVKYFTTHSVVNCI